MPGRPEDVATPPLRETVLSPRVRVLTLGGDGPGTSYGANCLAVAGDEATLLVDPLIAPGHARLVADAVARAGFPPVRHVVVTHHHTDHALGAAWLAGRGARVAAHEACARDMAAQHALRVAERRRDPGLAALFADAEPRPPSVTFRDRLSVELGGLRVEARHLGPGHTPGDCVVIVPSEGIAAAGDLLFHGYHYNYEEADRVGVRAGLDALAPLAERLVPGHGPPGGPELLRAQREYHDEAQHLAGLPIPEAEAAQALRERFRDHLLGGATGVAVRFWRAT